MSQTSLSWCGSILYIYNYDLVLSTKTKSTALKLFYLFYCLLNPMDAAVNG